jgi:hypothetical protein
MEGTVVQREILDLHADQIEKAMYSRSIPVLVDGGIVEKGAIRYHLIPSVDLMSAEVVQAAADISQAMRVEAVRITRVGRGYSLEVPVRAPGSLPLLPLLDSLGDLDPACAVVGMSSAGVPLIIDFKQHSTWNLICIAPEGSGKSEMVRTLSVSLARSSVPGELKLVGIDLSGNELTLLESMPQARFGVATSVAAAVGHLEWISQEIDRRAGGRHGEPELILVIDDLDDLIQWGGDDVEKVIRRVLESGCSAGVHLIASLDWPVLPKTQWISHVDGTVFATLPASRGSGAELEFGRFHLRAAEAEDEVEVAWMPVGDMNKAAYAVQQGSQKSVTWMGHRSV